MLSVGRTYRAENLFRMHWPKRRGKIQKYETENYKILQLSASGREQIEQQQELFASEDSGENAPNTSRQKIETSQIRVEQIMLTSLILVWTLTPMCCLFSWSATLFSYTTCLFHNASVVSKYRRTFGNKIFLSPGFAVESRPFFRTIGRYCCIFPFAHSDKLLVGPGKFYKVTAQCAKYTRIVLKYVTGGIPRGTSDPFVIGSA